MGGSNGKTPKPFEIPLSCLVSMLDYPELQIPWTAGSLEDYSEFHKIGFNIYKLINNKAKLTTGFPGLIFVDRQVTNFENFSGKSRFKKSIDIGTSHWPIKNKIFWLPTITNYLKDYGCKNDSCGYTSERKGNVTLHEETCTSVTIVSAKERIILLTVMYFVNNILNFFWVNTNLLSFKKQKLYGKPKHFMDELIEKKNLPKEFRDFTIDNFLTYDIEVVQKRIF